MMHSIILTIVLGAVPADRDLEELARSIEKAVAARDTAGLDALIDKHEIFDRARGDLKIPEATDQAFRKGAGMPIGKQIVDSLGDEGSYKFLRVRTVADERRLLFRLINQDGNNYHEHVLSLKGGTPHVADIYIYALGEKMSDVFRRSYLELIATQNRSLLDKLTGRQTDYVKSLPTFKKMYQLRAAGKWQEAYDAFRTLPAGLQKEKFTLVLAIFFAQKLGEDVYAKVLDEFMKAYPKDPAIDLISLDHYFLKKRYPEALRAIDRLDSSVDDPFLDLLRGNVHLTAGDTKKAKASLEKCIRREPGLLDAYWTLNSISLKAKDFAETARLLTEIEKQGVELLDLTTLPDYADFVKSKEYKEWAARRATTKGH